MMAVWLGAYSVQYYMWTAPAQVSPLTSGIVLQGFTASANSTGTYENGAPPTATTAAIPAQDATTGENATISLTEDAYIYFTITDADAATLDDYFTTLTIRIRLYQRDLVNAPAAADNYLYVVVDSVGQTGIENYSPPLSAAYQWDAVITVSYTTRALAATASDNIYLYIYAKEA
jgi:hypothetical protein